MKTQTIACDVCKVTIRPATPRFEGVSITLAHVNGERHATTLPLDDVCSVGCLHRGVEAAVQTVTRHEVRQSLAEFDEWLLQNAP